MPLRAVVLEAEEINLEINPAHRVELKASLTLKVVTTSGFIHLMAVY